MKIETRKQLADELLRGCPKESLEDHQRIASRILMGATLDEVITDEEAEAYPDTYHWLAGFSDLLKN